MPQLRHVSEDDLRVDGELSSTVERAHFGSKVVATRAKHVSRPRGRNTRVVRDAGFAVLRERLRRVRGRFHPDAGRELTVEGRVVIGGLPGTGKSTVAVPLARKLDAAYLRIDAIEQAFSDSGELSRRPTFVDRQQWEAFRFVEKQQQSSR